LTRESVERSIASATFRAVNELANFNGTAMILWCKAIHRRVSAKRFQDRNKTSEPELGGLGRVRYDSIRGNN
jgi:hypothetical protein